MSLQRCQEETTSTQFIDWMTYLEQDVNAFHREDYFLANIAKEVQRTIAKDRKSVKLKPFLLKFVREGVKRVARRPTVEKEATEKSKSRWLAWAGIKGKK